MKVIFLDVPNVPESWRFVRVNCFGLTVPEVFPVSEDDAFRLNAEYNNNQVASPGKFIAKVYSSNVSGLFLQAEELANMSTYHCSSAATWAKDIVAEVKSAVDIINNYEMAEMIAAQSA